MANRRIDDRDDAMLEYLSRRWGCDKRTALSHALLLATPAEIEGPFNRKTPMPPETWRARLTAYRSAETVRRTGRSSTKAPARTAR